MREIVFDAGAFIALERRDRRLAALVEVAQHGEVRIRTSSAVIAQVWRGGARQAQLARLLASEIIHEEALEPADAREIGIELGVRGASDIVDGHVALLARRRDAAVLTSDVGDFVKLGLPTDRIVAC